MKLFAPITLISFLLLSCAALLNCGCGYRSAGTRAAGEVTSVFVPIFENYSFRRGYEFELTRAVISQIQSEGILRVAPRDQADSELLGSILTYEQPVILEDPQDEVIEAKAGLTLRILWRDRRTDRVLMHQDNLNVSAPFIIPRGETEATAREELFKRIAENIVDLIAETSPVRKGGS